LSKDLEEKLQELVMKFEQIKKRNILQKEVGKIGKKVG